MKTYKIRNASVTDAKQLAELQERTFRDTFEASNDPDDMALHCATSYGVSIQEAEIRHPEMITLVCEKEGDLIAFTQLRWKDVPGVATKSKPLEIYRLYVDKPWHGKGIAQDLMDFILTLAKQLGSGQVWLGVWENNLRATSFYRKYAFTEVSEHIFMVGSDPQRDIIMMRSV